MSKKYIYKIVNFNFKKCQNELFLQLPIYSALSSGPDSQCLSEAESGAEFAPIFLERGAVRTPDKTGAEQTLLTANLEQISFCSEQIIVLHIHVLSSFRNLD